MRNCISILITMLLLMLLTCTVSGMTLYYDDSYHEYEGNIFSLQVNGKTLTPDMPPVVFNDYAVVPARAVFEEGLGASVGWNAEHQQVSVKMADCSLLLTINKTEVTINGRKETMPIAPKLINGYTMIPVRYVAEKLGMTVQFDNQTDTISVVGKTVIPSATSRPNGKAVVVNEVRTSVGQDTVFITIATNSQEPAYDAFILESPTRLVIDIQNATFKKLPTTIAIKQNNVDQVRFGQHEGSARVVVDLGKNAGYSLQKDGTDLRVSIGVDTTFVPAVQDVFQQITYGYEGGRDYVKFGDLKRGTPQKESGRITVPLYGNLPQEASEKKNTGFFSGWMNYEPVSNEEGKLIIHLKTDEVEMYEAGTEIRLKSVYKALPRSVMLDAGHGGQDAGAVSYNADGTIKAKEKDFNLDVTLRAKELLVAQGVDVHLIRSEDVYVDYQRVGSIANDASVSLFVSIHTNSFTAEQAHGIETFGYLEAGSVSNGMTSKRLSEILLEELIKQTGAHSRGVKDGKSLAVINSTRMPATLIEIGFISNPEECAKMMTEDYRQKLAQAVCDAVMRAFDEMDI